MIKRLMVALSLMPIMVLASTWHVNGSTESDANSGTSESAPMATIQAAMAVTADVMYYAQRLVSEAIVSSAATEGLPSVEDVRVDALVSSHWGQQTDTGYSNTGNPCFNYFTPSNYPCGCGATPIAQLLRYWRYPASVKAGVSRCLVDGVERQLAYGGVEYDYDAMPYVTAGADEWQRAAIGRLVFDCAVSLHSMFSSGNTLAFGTLSFIQLREIFGYSNAIGYVPAQSSVPFAAIKNTIIANLDAKCPVMIALVAKENGKTHQALIDGYGYHGGKLYFHFNLGWCNVRGGDVWYELDRTMDLDSGCYYNLIDGLVYNIFPDRTGDVLSGRVLDKDGKPVANVVVQASRNGKVIDTTQTDAKGIYAFVLAGDATYKVSCEGRSISVFLPSSVSANLIISSKDDGDIWQNPFQPILNVEGTLGGSSGNDIQLLEEPEPDPIMCTVTFNANGGDGGWSSNLVYGTAIVAPTVTREGYLFSSWLPTVAATVPASNVTYTAQWTINQYTVTFNANGGSGSTTRTVTSGAAVGALPMLTRKGYELVGWFTAAEGGTAVTASTVVTANVTYYAQWMPYGGKVKDVSFATAQTVDGVLYSADGKFAGTVQLKAGKKDKKKGVVKISATATLMDGKKITGKAVTVNLNGDGTMSGTVKFKAPVGDMQFEMAEDGTFTFDNSGYLMTEVKVGGNLPNGTMTFMVDIDSIPALPAGYDILVAALPLNPTATVSGGKKIDFGKAATVKYAKVKEGKAIWYVLDGLNDAKKPNRSGLKLTYTPNTGLFKGTFKIYATNEESIAEGKKPTLKTYTVNVTGFFVDGVGSGQATMSKSAGGPWSVTVR